MRLPLCSKGNYHGGGTNLYDYLADHLVLCLVDKIVPKRSFTLLSLEMGTFLLVAL